MASKSTDIHVTGVTLYFLPVEMRVPLKFGHATMTSATCARAAITVADANNHTAVGWGETPMSVHWAWPSSLSYEERLDALKAFSVQLASAWQALPTAGHPMSVGFAFQETVLLKRLKDFNESRGGEPMPWLAALVCCSAFDVALHDAFGKLVGKPVYQTYTAEYMNNDLSHFIEPADRSDVSFAGKYPADFFVPDPPTILPAWHLVGGKDLIDPEELTGQEPKDGYPVLLRDWIRTDGLTCLKVKLRGNDPQWDYARIVKVGQMAIEEGALWLTTDFNCTVTDPAYVNEILDRLCLEHPRIYGMVLYVEQPFPYDLEEHQIDVHSVSARKPLFMDESCHDWKLIRLGRSLGWTGVALKTCKTQTGAMLSLCWAKAHGMTLMVQDLTNPMLAQIPHCLLAAYAGTIMGVETNSMQFYPAASLAEEAVHPGLYKRRNGCVSLDTIQGPGFGYRVEEIQRKLPDPVISIQ